MLRPWARTGQPELTRRPETKEEKLSDYDKVSLYYIEEILK